MRWLGTSVAFLTIYLASCSYPQKGPKEDSALSAPKQEQPAFTGSTLTPEKATEGTTQLPGAEVTRAKRSYPSNPETFAIPVDPLALQALQVQPTTFATTQFPVETTASTDAGPEPRGKRHYNHHREHRRQHDKYSDKPSYGHKHSEEGGYRRPAYHKHEHHDHDHYDHHHEHHDDYGYKPKKGYGEKPKKVGYGEKPKKQEPKKSEKKEHSKKDYGYEHEEYKPKYEHEEYTPKYEHEEYHKHDYGYKPKYGGYGDEYDHHHNHRGPHRRPHFHSHEDDEHDDEENPDAEQVANDMPAVLDEKTETTPMEVFNPPATTAVPLPPQPPMQVVNIEDLRPLFQIPENKPEPQPQVPQGPHIIILQPHNSHGHHHHIFPPSHPPPPQTSEPEPLPVKTDEVAPVPAPEVAPEPAPVPEKPVKTVDEPKPSDLFDLPAHIKPEGNVNWTALALLSHGSQGQQQGWETIKTLSGSKTADQPEDRPQPQPSEDVHAHPQTIQQVLTGGPSETEELPKPAEPATQAPPQPEAQTFAPRPQPPEVPQQPQVGRPNIIVIRPDPIPISQPQPEVPQPQPQLTWSPLQQVPIVVQPSNPQQDQPRPEVPQPQQPQPIQPQPQQLPVVRPETQPMPVPQPQPETPIQQVPPPLTQQPQQLPQQPFVVGFPPQQQQQPQQAGWSPSQGWVILTPEGGK